MFYDIGEKKGNIQIIPTADGSFTLFNKKLGEIYHSRNGAINESGHVFIHAGLEYIEHRFREINILEIGFGTGLNALLTAIKAEKANLKISYVSYDSIPLNDTIINKLNYAAFFEDKGATYWSAIHECGWNKDVQVHDHFLLKKVHQDILNADLENGYYNLVYYDAFSPEVQPWLWTRELFEKIYRSMKNGGILVTYSSKGEVKRNLQASKFRVERIRGPEGKRHMIRAEKQI